MVTASKDKALNRYLYWPIHSIFQAYNASVANPMILGNCPKIWFLQMRKNKQQPAMQPATLRFPVIIKV
jgi:hypothetical protein